MYRVNTINAVGDVNDYNITKYQFMNLSNNVEFTKHLRPKKMHYGITLETNFIITLHCFIRLNIIHYAKPYENNRNKRFNGGVLVSCFELSLRCVWKPSSVIFFFFYLDKSTPLYKILRSSLGIYLFVRRSVAHVQ